MKRLYWMLGISQVLVVWCAIWLYCDPSLWACLAGSLGAFIRMMIPYPQEANKYWLRRVLFFVEVIGGIILFGWLRDLGIYELLDKARTARFSIAPAIACGLILATNLIKDWLWLRQLSEAEIDDFYKKKV